KGLETLQVNGVAQNPDNSKILLEGSQDNGHAATTDTGTTWNKVGGGDGMLVRFNPIDGAWVYKFEQNGDFRMSNFGGTTEDSWSVHTPIAADKKVKFP